MSQPIEVIPVLDISGGIAVHARGGVRDRYAPVESVLSPGAPGDALAIARAYRRLGARRCYVADLDAIRGRPAQLDLLSRLRGSAGFNGPIMVDAGIATPEEASPVAADGHALVVGLENMRSLAALTALAWRWRVVFSIDLRDGEPIRRPELAGDPRTHDIVALARAAAEADVAEVLLLDLARVGRETGPDVTQLQAVREVLPDAGLLVGGGVRNQEDLAMLAEAGCDGALVATALHRGVITRL
jgi:phosphoribosylformimino-5-aminoimidazole carboxamide ribotide isomerase